MKKDGTTQLIKLKNYGWAPKLARPLYSIPYTMLKGFVLSGKHKDIWLSKGTTRVEFDHILTTGSSHLNCIEIVPVDIKDVSEKTELSAVGTDKVKRKVKFVDELEAKKPSINLRKQDFQVWHEKLGHVSDELTARTAKRLGASLKKRERKCVSCAMAKAKKKPVNKFSKS